MNLYLTNKQGSKTDKTDRENNLQDS